VVAANRRSNCSLKRAMDGRIVRCGIISSCQSAATSEIVKRFWATIKSAIARARLCHLRFYMLRRLHTTTMTECSHCLRIEYRRKEIILNYYKIKPTYLVELEPVQLLSGQYLVGWFQCTVLCSMLVLLADDRLFLIDLTRMRSSGSWTHLTTPSGYISLQLRRLIIDSAPVRWARAIPVQVVHRYYRQRQQEHE